MHSIFAIVLLVERRSWLLGGRPGRRCSGTRRRSERVLQRRLFCRGDRILDGHVECLSAAPARPPCRRSRRVAQSTSPLAFVRVGGAQSSTRSRPPVSGCPLLREKLRSVQRSLTAILLNRVPRRLGEAISDGNLESATLGFSFSSAPCLLLSVNTPYRALARLLSRLLRFRRLKLPGGSTSLIV